MYYMATVAYLVTFFSEVSFTFTEQAFMSLSRNEREREHSINQRIRDGRETLM